MSATSTSYKLYSNSSNAISGVALYDATGAMLTPSSVTDVAGGAGSFQQIATRTFTIGEDGIVISPANLTLTEAGLYRFVPISGQFWTGDPEDHSGNSVDIRISGGGGAGDFYQSREVTVTAEMIAAGGVVTFAQNYGWFACEIGIEKMSAGDGYNRKSITFASAVEAVFVNPVFADPNAPVPVILAYESGGKLYNVLDNVELVSDRPAVSSRPAPRLSHLPLYTKAAGVWSIAVPEQFAPKIKARTKDPMTGDVLYGNDFSMLWYGMVPNAIQVQCDVEDITDPAGWFDLNYTNATTYAESSVGMSLVKITGEIIPRDGFIHTLKFRIRYNAAGDVSAWVEGPLQQALYALAPPGMPSNVSAVVLRDRIDTIPDRVKISWTWNPTVPGDAVEVYAIDYMGKKHLLGEETDQDTTEMTVENVSRFIVQDAAPANQSAYRFAVLAKNRSSKTDLAYSAATYQLTNKVKDLSPPTPDEIAGTAESASFSSLMAKVNTVVQNAANLTAEQKVIAGTIYPQIIIETFKQIKTIVMLGGDVTVDNFGVFAAKWSNERWGRNPSNGDPVLIPAARGTAFAPSLGYKTGTKYGVILTDTQAKTYTP